jgi:aryl-alcohol dehydrogenase-like predicted oxidoreductase
MASGDNTAPISRRSFVKHTAAAATLAAFNRSLAAKTQPSKIRSHAPAAAAGSVLVGGDLAVNRIGLGTAEFTGPNRWGEPTDPRGLRQLLRRALDLGVNMIDTADVYGPRVAERYIYDALYPYPKELVIATKGGQTHDVPGEANGFDARPEQLRAACEASLKRLHLEQIPLYYLHTPDPNVPFEESMGELARLQKEGKIRHIGVSKVDAAQLAKAQSMVKVAALQNPYNVLARGTDEFIGLCERDHIVFIPNSPLGRNHLDPADSRLAGLTALADKHRVSFSQAVLAWLLTRSPIILAIPGTTQIGHLEEDIAAAAVHFSREEMRAVG